MTSAAPQLRLLTMCIGCLLVCCAPNDTPAPQADLAVDVASQTAEPVAAPKPLAHKSPPSSPEREALNGPRADLIGRIEADLAARKTPHEALASLHLLSRWQASDGGKDWRANYYEGVIHAQRGRSSQALESWRRAFDRLDEAVRRPWLQTPSGLKPHRRVVVSRLVAALLGVGRSNDAWAVLDRVAQHEAVDRWRDRTPAPEAAALATKRAMVQRAQTTEASVAAASETTALVDEWRRRHPQLALPRLRAGAVSRGLAPDQAVLAGAKVGDTVHYWWATRAGLEQHSGEIPNRWFEGLEAFGQIVLVGAAWPQRHKLPDEAAISYAPWAAQLVGHPHEHPRAVQTAGDPDQAAALQAAIKGANLLSGPTAERALHRARRAAVLHVSGRCALEGPDAGFEAGGLKIGIAQILAARFAPRWVLLSGCGDAEGPSPPLVDALILAGASAVAWTASDVQGEAWLRFVGALHAPSNERLEVRLAEAPDGIKWQVVRGRL